MTYKLKLETKSMLLAGSGEGGVLIDADVVFHPSGFPFIPARRVKGMLKESLEEVMEISGKTKEEITQMLKSLFGQGGTKRPEGKLIFRNLYLQDWQKIKAHFPKLQASPEAFHPDFIKAYFTSEIQQTAIDLDGIAKDHSLRNYRVLHPDLSFEAEIRPQKELDGQEWEFLRKAVSHWRYAGTRRNRGFGKIKCSITAVQSNGQDQTNDKPAKVLAPSRLFVTIETKAPVILGLQKGDQNTVFTQRQITGNHLRGLLAGTYISRQKNLKRDLAQQDEKFRRIFLSGALKFGYLTFKGEQMISRRLHEFKGRKDKPVLCVFSRDKWSEEDQKLITKPLSYYASISSDKKIQRQEPQTTFYFHNSRQIRRAGRSMEDQTEGGIFYYEALNEGQRFEGEIVGDAKTLKDLAAAFPKPFRSRIGKSKSAQYAEVLVTLMPGKTEESTPENTNLPGQYLLTLESPLILFNEFGAPSADAEILQQYLAEILGLQLNELELKKAASAITFIEQFNGAWESKSGKYMAFKEGSAFLWELKEKTSGIRSSRIGEYTEQGFGKIRWNPFTENEVFNRKKEDSKASDASAPADWISTGLDVLDDIYTRFEQQKLEATIMKKAIDDAQEQERRKASINNHLISRMEQLFERKNRFNEIDEWIAKTKGKPAGEALKKADLINDDHQFKLNRSRDFSTEKLYWLTFFRTLRKLNKKENGK